LKKLISLSLTLVILTFFGCSTCQNTEITISNIDYPSYLEIVKRNDWGWKKLDKQKPIHKIKYVTLHHGGEEFAKDKDVIKYLQNLQSWSRAEKNWIDNPYHFMIDLEGKIYETRPIEYPGDTNTKYDPTGHALICVMGNYEIQKISKQQLESVAKLSAFLCKTYNVPVENIKAHKDYVETLCPGEDFYKYLSDGTIIEMVKNKLATK